MAVVWLGFEYPTLFFFSFPFPFSLSQSRISFCLSPLPSFRSSSYRVESQDCSFYLRVIVNRDCNCEIQIARFGANFRFFEFLLLCIIRRRSLLLDACMLSAPPLPNPLTHPPYPWVGGFTLMNPLLPLLFGSSAQHSKTLFHLVVLFFFPSYTSCSILFFIFLSVSAIFRF